MQAVIIRKLRKKNCCAERLAEFGVDSLCMEWTAAAPVRILPVVFSQGGLSRDKQKQPQDTTGDSSCFIFHLYKGIFRVYFETNKFKQTSISQVGEFTGGLLFKWTTKVKRRRRPPPPPALQQQLQQQKNKINSQLLNKKEWKKTTVSISE